MITLTPNHTATRDKFQWILEERIESPESKRGHTTRETYHPNLKRCITTVLDREAGKCESLEEILKYISSFEAKLNELLPNERDL